MEQNAMFLEQGDTQLGVVQTTDANATTPFFKLSGQIRRLCAVVYFNGVAAAGVVKVKVRKKKGTAAAVDHVLTTPVIYKAGSTDNAFTVFKRIRPTAADVDISADAGGAKNAVMGLDILPIDLGDYDQVAVQVYAGGAARVAVVTWVAHKANNPVA